MRKKEGNKETAIIEAAVKVFAENGYHQIKNQQDLREVAGVAQQGASIYITRARKISFLKIFDQLWLKLSKRA